MSYADLRPLPELGPIPLEPEGSDKMVIELGPSHPAMHGTVKVRARLNGESIERADVDVGYLHRGFEKSCENAMPGVATNTARSFTVLIT